MIQMHKLTIGKRSREQSISKRFRRKAIILSPSEETRIERGDYLFVGHSHRFPLHQTRRQNIEQKPTLAELKSYFEENNLPELAKAIPLFSQEILEGKIPGEEIFNFLNKLDKSKDPFLLGTMLKELNNQLDEEQAYFI